MVCRMRMWKKRIYWEASYGLGIFVSHSCIYGWKAQVGKYRFESAGSKTQII